MSPLPPRPTAPPALARPGMRCPRTGHPCNCQQGGIDHQRCMVIANHGRRPR